MRRLFGWLAGLVGIAAAARYLARRERAARAQTARPASDPAEELRRKLSESRAEQPAAPAAEPADEAQAEPRESLEERRARVHAKAEAAISAMQEPPT